MLIQKEGHGATKITSDFEHEIQCLESTFRTEIEPELLQDLTRDQDSLIDKLLLEVSCGVGGQEAMLFASELFNLYERYCIFKNWTFSSINCDSSNLGGIRSASVQISGTQCFYHLRNEAGVHRVQRIPLTEKSGRVHTSTAAVHVIPVDNRQGSLSVIDERDVKMTTKRATGAGGQHVNKTESAVVLTHVPTNTVVECQEERHQYLNREKAMQKLQMILTLKERERIIDNYERTKTTQVPSKDRNQKIRTYNFPQDRITDHRLSDNIHNIRSMMEGNDVSKLEEIIKRLNDNAKKQVIDNLIKELYCK
jgi:peptide chain release factor 1